MAAVVIALSTAYTAIILRRQNRTDEDPARGKDPGGHEIVFHLSNTGRYEENVETAHYHIRHAGWQEVPPQNPMGFKIAPASQHDPSPRIEEVSKTDYPKVNTPFLVPPERSHELVYRLQPPQAEKFRHITCIKVITLKGESIHHRFSHAEHRLSWVRSILCRLGKHR